MDAIASGTEVRRYVRIQVIGKHRVGKSSLVRRLLGENIKGVKSTDGIDVVKRCLINTKNNEWIVDTGKLHVFLVVLLYCCESYTFSINSWHMSAF